MSRKKFFRMILPNLMEVHAYTEGQVKKSSHIFDVRMQKVELVRRERRQPDLSLISPGMADLFGSLKAGKKGVTDIVCGDTAKKE